MFFKRFFLWLQQICKCRKYQRDRYGWAEEIEHLLHNYNNALVLFYHLNDRNKIGEPKSVNIEFWKILFHKTSFQEIHFNYDEIAAKYLSGDIDFNRENIEHFFENHLKLDEQYISQNLPKIIEMLEVNDLPAKKFETTGMLIAIEDMEYQVVNVDRIAVMLSVALNHAEKKDLTIRDCVKTAPRVFTNENKLLIFDLKLRVVGKKFGFEIGEKSAKKLNDLLFSFEKMSQK